MQNKYTIKHSTTGLHLIVGKGFVSATQKGATEFLSGDANDQIKCAQAMGINATYVVVPQVKSYAVNYVRTGDVNADGSINANKRNPSKRRFATKDEAIQHGSRFSERRKNANDAEGTAGHVGFWVSESFDAVNAEINWKTGLTNAK
jgi:hypothetical protein